MSLLLLGAAAQNTVMSRDELAARTTQILTGIANLGNADSAPTTAAKQRVEFDPRAHLVRVLK